MEKLVDREIRYFIDLDLRTREIIGWGLGHRKNLAAEKLPDPCHHRMFITKGQYNKLVNKHRETGSVPYFDNVGSK